MNDWASPVGNELDLNIEELKHDRYAVAIIVSGDIFGHVPRKFWKIVYYFIKWVYRSSLRMLRTDIFENF